ncbi:MAG: ATP-binding protein [Bacteroidales bacterium]|nr:ATP-binding protein [Bacteroidales bacterium]MDT8374958.1 ATP-binding protein [Bacteroidales bacterium]
MSGKTEKKSDAPYGATDRDHDPVDEAYTIAGGIAHDLNTILTAIYGYSELALESAGDAAAVEKYIRRIIGAADRAKSLTGQLIDLSRGALQPRQSENIGDILADTVRFIRPSAGDNITVTEKINEPGLMVDAVPAQLFRLFVNVAVNALQAMKEKGGNLEISVDAVRDSNDSAGAPLNTALVQFTDTGRGMDRETTEKLFTPFLSAGDREGGTGLGMMVVSAIMRDLGGAIRINSKPGTGTVVGLLIPLSGFGPLDEKSYLRETDK